MREPHQAVHRQVLASGLDPREIPNADLQSGSEILLRQTLSFSKVRDATAGKAQNLVGVLSSHLAEEAATGPP